MLHNQEADITAERAQSSAINIRKLTETFHGGKDAWERKQFLFSLLENEPVFNRRDRFFLGRTEVWNPLCINKYPKQRNSDVLQCLLC